ncbi:MAG: inorganic phosphate transporter [Rhodospirillaceae bacterium]|jgi:PiT family inorganic phosphate transporter|nr:inorganic phosphate transporter [Rhodospirillaceae bacterium]
MYNLSSDLSIIIAIILIALVFDFINGMHDAANSIATVISTRVLSPKIAVAWAAGFNFIAFLFFGLHVAKTVGIGIVEPSVMDTHVIFSALLGAIMWNLVTWWLGLPSSSSHALIGGIVGAGVAKAGTSIIVVNGFLKTIVAIILSPLAGFMIAMLIVLSFSWILRQSLPYAIDSKFRKLQLLSASLYSLGHGGNDAQKTMGIITVLLFSQGLIDGDFYVPLWVVLISQLAMSLGTLAGGWRIVRTLGTKITDLKPFQGFCAETAGAISLFTATWFGIPVSTTHTITSAIVGVGSARRTSAVRWGLASNIIYSWIFTIPVTSCISFIMYSLLHLIL